MSVSNDPETYSSCDLVQINQSPSDSVSSTVKCRECILLASITICDHLQCVIYYVWDK
jgi:hypothetical protein